MTVASCIPPLLSLIGFGWLAGFAARFHSSFPGRKLFVGICILGCFLYIDVLIIFNISSETAALWVSRIDHIFILYLIPLYLQFFSVYLGIDRYRKVIRIVYGASFLLMLSAPTDWLIRGMQRHDFGYWAVGGDLYWLVGLLAACSITIVFSMLLQAIRSTRRSVYRIKLIYMGIGFGVLGLLIGLNILPILGFSIYPPGNFAFIPLGIFAFGLFRYDLLGMNLLVRRGLLYGLTGLVLSAVYATALWSMHLVLPVSNDASMLLFTFVFFLLVGISIGPLQSRLQERIDGWIGRDARQYPAIIRALSRDIVTLQESHRIVERLVDTVHASMKLTACAFYRNQHMEQEPDGDEKQEALKLAVFRGSSSETGFPETYRPDVALRQTLLPHAKTISIETVQTRMGASLSKQLLADMETLGASLIVPLVCQHHLHGVLIVSDKISGEPFTSEDIRLLDILAGQSALALENAITMEQLRNLNQELEHKVAERTRSLQEALENTRRMQEQMIRSESLASIGTLVAGTAHELNNPLASADSLVQSVLEELRENPEILPDILEDLAFIRRQLGKARDIVRSLLGLSRQHSEIPESIHLPDVIQDALKVLHNRLKHTCIRIDVVQPETIPEFPGSFGDIGRLVLNLVDNAIQAVDPRKGIIQLEVSVDFEGRRIIFRCDDNGPGVPPDIRKDMFKPFFTTKPPGQGTGLGLYICHEIAVRHGAHIQVETSPILGGARFQVTFPMDTPIEPSRRTNNANL